MTKYSATYITANLEIVHKIGDFEYDGPISEQRWLVNKAIKSLYADIVIFSDVEGATEVKLPGHRLWMVSFKNDDGLVLIRQESAE